MDDQKIERIFSNNTKRRNLFEAQHKKLFDLQKIGILSDEEFEIHTFYLKNILKGAKGLIKEIKENFVKNINENFYKRIFVLGQVGLKKLENFDKDDLFIPISEALVNFIYMVNFMNKRKNEILNDQISNPHIVRHYNKISFIKMLNEVSKLFKDSINKILISKCTLRTYSGLEEISSDFTDKIYDKYVCEEIVLSNLSKSFTNKNVESTLLVLTFKKEKEFRTDDSKVKRCLRKVNFLRSVENQPYEEIYLPYNMSLSDYKLNRQSLKTVKNESSDINILQSTLLVLLLFSISFFWIYRFLKNNKNNKLIY